MLKKIMLGIGVTLKKHLLMPIGLVEHGSERS
jgi:hypothetical protein